MCVHVYTCMFVYIHVVHAFHNLNWLVTSQVVHTCILNFCIIFYRYLVCKGTPAKMLEYLLTLQIDPGELDGNHINQCYINYIPVNDIYDIY